MRAIIALIILAIILIAAYLAWSEFQPAAPSGGHPKQPDKPPPVSKPQVYLYDVGHNGIPPAEIETVAKNMDAKVATLDQLEDAQKAGAQWCHYGWANASITGVPIYRPYFPMQHSKYGCGHAGINSPEFLPPGGSFGVVLYGLKPKEGRIPMCLPTSMGECAAPWDESEGVWDRPAR